MLSIGMALSADVLHATLLGSLHIRDWTTNPGGSSENQFKSFFLTK